VVQFEIKADSLHFDPFMHRLIYGSVLRCPGIDNGLFYGIVQKVYRWEGDMYTDTEKTYLLKAVTAFERKISVISPDFIILATNGLDSGGKVPAASGTVCHESFHDRQATCENCPAKEVFRTGKSAFKSGTDNNREPGKVFCLYAYPIMDGEAVEAAVVLDFDFPSTGGLEEKLQRSNAFLRNLIGSSVDAIIAADRAGKILFFNDAAVEVTGYSVEEAVTDMDIRILYPGEGAKEVMRILRSDEYGGKGKLKSYQVDLLNMGGEVIPISLNAAVVYEGEREVATIGFFHDMRDTLKMRKELEKTQVQLLQAEKMSSLGKLAAGVAHQLNNPLGGITLYAQLMMEEYKLEDPAMEDLQRILKDAQRCSNTVKELLEFARQTKQEMRPNDMNRAISRTLFLLENQAIFQNIEIEKNLASSLPMVPGDIQQLNHLFMNIILNAAEAMEGSGKLTVTTGHKPKGDRISITIADTGPGISEDVLPQVFEPFYTTKEEGKGTGLGLSLAYRIVESHRGRLMAKNIPDSGATFIIELPIKQDSGDNDGE
jgi:two-component system, NtrC family, sensor kinase